MKITNVLEKMIPLDKASTLKQAMSAILQADTDFLPVIDGQAQYCGVVTVKGLLAALAENQPDSPVEPWLQRDLPAILPDRELDDVLTAVNGFVVINDGQKVAGIVTSARLAKSLLEDLLELEAMANKTTGVSSFRFELIKDLNSELEAIINSSYDGIFITDGDGVVLKINAAYERITGVTADEVVGKNMASLVKAGLYDHSVTLLVLERRERVTINQVVKRNNKHILATGNPIFDERGDISRVVTNVRDVTELNNLQSKLSKTVAETLKYQTELSHLRSLQLKSADLIFRSRSMAAVVELAVKVADVSSTVLIMGESGTGKEMIAKLIHCHGKGEDKPFIKINCGAIPENLLESELFGYEHGAFTGARKEGKPGLFELANRGTLFLDEIGEMPPLLQVKLLRAIQEKTVMRVGGITPTPVDVRIVAATHRNLSQMVAAGTFREDLYYRLMVVPIQIPPLRDRKEDIPLLIMNFIEKHNKKFGFAKTVSAQVIDRLTEYSWPGNVRELENVIERMMVTTPENEITPAVLPNSILQSKAMPQAGTRLKDAVAHTEKMLLTETFREHGSWHKVAEVLGIDRTTAFRKAVKYGLIDKEK